MKHIHYKKNKITIFTEILSSSNKLTSFQLAYIYDSLQCSAHMHYKISTPFQKEI